MKYIYILLILLIFSPSLVRAQTSPVSAELKMDYQFTSVGDSVVTTSIELTNQTSNAYAQDFHLQVKGMVTSQVAAYDDQGSIPVEVTPADQATNIKITFLHPVGGKGRTQTAHIKYSGPKATLKDKIWELAIPAVSQGNLVSSAQVSITTPPDFGIPVETHPAPQKAETLSSGQKRVTYQSTSGGTSKLVVRYGNFQTYKFDLEYTIKNTSKKTESIAVHLPADSFDHQLNYTLLTPDPVNVTADSNNAWDALYDVPAGKTVNISATGISSSQQSPLDFFKTFTPNATIAPAQYQYDSSAQPEVSWRRPWQYWPFISNDFTVEIKNPNGAALYSVPVLVTSSGFELTNQLERTIDVLPPFGKVIIPLRFKREVIPPQQPWNVTLGVSATSITYNITDTYVIAWYVSIIVFITAIIIALAFFTVKARHLHLQKRR